MTQDWDAEDIYEITLEFGPCSDEEPLLLFAQLREDISEKFSYSTAHFRKIPRRFSHGYAETQDPADYFAWRAGQNF